MTQLEALEFHEECFNPFPGLRPFEPEEDHLFFGRERETDALLRRLRTNRFVSVLGTSGSGKSSLVRSGLIPSLHSGFMVKAGSAWRVAMLRPGENPVGNLADALSDEDVLGGDPELGHTHRMLLETTLRRSSLGLADCVRHAHLPEHENLLVVVDQFEELFRFKERRKVHDARDEAVAFAKLLLEAAAQEEMPVYVIITMRSDFIGDCMEYPKLPEAINEGQYLIPRMTRDELRAAITGPVAVGGGTIAPRLVARLLNEIGDDPDQLPVLQHALMRTWNEWEVDQSDAPLDVQHYEKTGTMAEALSRHAEDAFGELDSAERLVAEVLFKALTDKGQDGRGVRHPTPISEVAEIADVDQFKVIAVVDTFRRSGRSFLMPPSTVELSGNSIIDLSHESLMRLWTRLVDWVEEEEASGKAFRRLCRASRRYAKKQAGLWVQPELALGLKWREDNRPTAAWAKRYAPDFEEALGFLDASKAADERRIEEEEAARLKKLRRARILATVLGSAAVLTFVFGLFALRAGRIARVAEQRASREAETAQAVSGFLVDLFDVVDPEEARGATITAREILDSGADKIDAQLADQPGVQARLMGTIGKVYGSLGLYDEAGPLLERAHVTALGALGEGHPETLQAGFRLGEFYWNKGRFGDAEASLSRTLEGRREVLGADAPDTLKTMTALAETLQSQGRLSEAEENVRAALEGQRRVLREEHEDTVASMHRLGDLLAENGRYAEAEQLLVQAWETQRRTLGDEHPDTLATMADLGSLYTNLGRYDEAEKLYNDSLESRRAVFGDDHPKTLVALYRVGNLALERGRWPAAEEIFLKVLDERQRQLGDDHPSTIQSKGTLAWLYRLQSRLEKAAVFAEDAYQTALRVFGDDHPKMLEWANVRAIVSKDQGRFDLAEKLLARNLEIYQRLYGESNPDTLSARNNIGVVYADWGRREQATEMYQQNLEIAREAFGDDNPNTLFYAKNLVWHYNNQRRREEAEALAVDTLDRYRRVLGNDHPDTIDGMQALAQIRRSQKRFDEAKALLKERLEGNRRVFGDEHPRTMWSIATLAGLHQQLGDNEAALPFRKQVLEIALRLFGEEHPDTISAYNSLGWNLQSLNQPKQALEHRRKALDIRRRMAEREDAGAHYEHAYASALVRAQSELQDPRQAVKYALAANRNSEYQNRDYVATLAEAYFRAGNTDKAIEVQQRALALIPEADPRARTRYENRLGEFYRASGNPEMVRKAQLDELAREKSAAEKPDASPRARNDYAWELLVADPADLRDPRQALQVALAVNEETDFSDHQLLETLGLAYHLTGQRQKAVEVMDKVLGIVPKDDVWTRYRMEQRRAIFDDDGGGTRDVATFLGSWTLTFGPVQVPVEVQREGNMLVARNRASTQWRPKDSIMFRIDPRTADLEIYEADNGFTNLRYETGDYRTPDSKTLICWNPKSWFPLLLERN